MEKIKALTKSIELLLILFSTTGLAQNCSKFNENLKPQELVEYVGKSSYLRVEDILCKLPKSLLSQYSIEIYSETGAAQSASTNEPRVHLFSNSMVLTFNGSSKQVGGDEIELGYEDENQHQAVVLDLYLPGKNPLVRDPSKLGCLACHGSTESPSTGVRLLFNAAPVWMGFLGVSGFGGDEGFGQYYENEKSILTDFKKMAKGHPRYKNLLDLDEKSVTQKDLEYEYRDPVNHIGTMRVHYEHLLGHINLEYSFLLARFNHNRLLGLIMNSPDYDKYRYAIYATLVGCQSIETFLPPKVQRYHSNEEYLYPFLRGPITKKMFAEAARQAQFRALIKGTAENYGFTTNRNDDHLSYARETVNHPPLISKFTIDSDIRQEFYGANVGYADLRYLFEGRKNPVSMREWSIDPKKGYYRFNNKEGVDDDEILIGPMLRKYDPILASHSEFEGLDKFISGPGESAANYEKLVVAQEVACKELKKDSLEALANLDVRVKPALKESGYQTLERNCKTCHTLNVLGAPTFDFSNQKNFELFATKYDGLLGKRFCDRITRNEHDSGAMPRVGPMRPSEIERVLAYMRSLGIVDPSCSVTDLP